MTSARRRLLDKPNWDKPVTAPREPQTRTLTQVRADLRDWCLVGDSEDEVQTDFLIRELEAAALREAARPTAPAGDTGLRERIERLRQRDSQSEPDDYRTGWNDALDRVLALASPGLALVPVADLDALAANYPLPPAPSSASTAEREAAWLIEVGQSEGFDVPRWWIGDQYPRWTTVATEAQRFATRAAADGEIRRLSGGLHSRTWFGRATQHVFLAPSSASTGPLDAARLATPPAPDDGAAR